MKTPCLALTLAAFLLPTAPARAHDVAAEMEEAMQARVKNDRFSGAVLVARDGQVIFRRGYGMANLESDVPNTPETKFRLGSITKQFTAMAVMILQDRGKLDVREKVKTYLTDSPAAWDEVTVHHLLTHTSGIPSYTGMPDYLARMREPTTPDQLLARFKDRPLEFTPGARFKYSNSGYAVLGKLIEKVSGQGYADFLRESVFKPLGMNDTGYDRAAQLLKRRASGYSRSLFANVNASYLDMSIPYAAGGLYSTVDDLLLWDQALYTEKLVSGKTIGAIFTPFKDDYGYGWVISKEFGRKVYGHGGGINGFVTDIKRFPGEKLCVVVLSNDEGSPVGAVGHELAAVALGEPVKARGKGDDDKAKTGKKAGTGGPP